MIESKEVRWCWGNKIFIAPVPININSLYIEVYRIEFGLKVILKKGNKKYRQKNDKDKKELYNAIYTGYKYYYNKFNKNENR